MSVIIDSTSSRIARVAMIGAGPLASAAAYALLMSSLALEIVLVDKERQRAMACVADLRDAALFSPAARVIAGDFSDCSDADILVVTAQPEKPAELQSIIAEIARCSPRGVLLIASEPVDVLTFASWRWSGLPVRRVIGVGTALDTLRFRARLGERYGVCTDEVDAYVVGEHGESQVPMLSNARITGIPLEEFASLVDVPYDEAAVRAMGRAYAPADVVDAAATYYGLGAAIVRIVRAIVRNERAVLTVSSVLPAAMGRLRDAALALPTIVGKDGVVRVLSIPQSENERYALEASADAVKMQLNMLSLPEPAIP